MKCSNHTAWANVTQTGDQSLAPWIERCVEPMGSAFALKQTTIYGDDFRLFIDGTADQKTGILCLTDINYTGSILNLVNRGICHVVYRNSPFADAAVRLALQHHALGQAPSYSELYPPLDVIRVTRKVTTPGDFADLLVDTESSLEFHIPDRCKKFVRLAIKEAVTNAIYHAFREPGSHGRKYNPESFIGLYDGDMITVEHCNTTDWLSITVTDNSGSLGPLSVANSMDRQHSDRGLLDMRGRGFYLMHQISDRMIIRIERRVKTSVQMFFMEKENTAPRHFELLIS